MSFESIRALVSRSQLARVFGVSKQIPLGSVRGGFTLIELLVVIAVIGVISAVVLAALNTARSKGSDGSIKTNLSTVATQAELYYDTNGSYGSTASGCSAAMYADPTIRAAIVSAANQIPSAAEATNYRCTANSITYAVMMKLTGTSSGWWCIDSTGVRKSYPSSQTLLSSGSYACP